MNYIFGLRKYDVQIVNLLDINGCFQTSFTGFVRYHNLCFKFNINNRRNAPRIGSIPIYVNQLALFIQRSSCSSCKKFFPQMNRSLG